jgi:Brp/Blh family beta-carotene 15,15'-monooxygenase
MNALRLQGVVFSGVALLLAAAADRLALPDTQTTLVVLAVLIVFFGVPHGALDPIFAQRLYQIRTVAGWIQFTAAYIALAALMVVLWWLAPTVFLLAFLLLSVVHFSGDLAPGAAIVSRVLYGGALVVLPALLHSSELTRLFSMLVDASAAQSLVAALHLIAWPWLLAMVLAAAYSARANWLTALEIVSVAALAASLTPLVAFTVFFCGMHSARHILRTKKYANSSARRLFLTSAAPMLAVLCIAAVAWQLSEQRLPVLPVNVRLVQLLFVALAALTVPHMVLVERVRLVGWDEAGTKN